MASRLVVALLNESLEAKFLNPHTPTPPIASVTYLDEAFAQERQAVRPLYRTESNGSHGSRSHLRVKDGKPGDLGDFGHLERANDSWKQV